MPAVAACDGEAAALAPASAQLFLASLPRCAYTTALVRGGRSVADWGLHMERLARSIRALHTALDGLYAAYYSWLEVRRAQQPAWRPLDPQRLCQVCVQALLPQQYC